MTEQKDGNATYPVLLDKQTWNCLEKRKNIRSIMFSGLLLNITAFQTGIMLPLGKAGWAILCSSRICFAMHLLLPKLWVAFSKLSCMAWLCLLLVLLLRVVQLGAKAEQLDFWPRAVLCMHRQLATTRSHARSCLWFIIGKQFVSCQRRNTQTR